MIKCSRCSNDNADDAKHCGYCGTQLQAQQVKRTMFGMAAIPPEEVERLRKLQMASTPTTPSATPTRPEPAAARPGLPPRPAGLPPRPAGLPPRPQAATATPKPAPPGPAATPAPPEAPVLDTGLGGLDLDLGGAEPWALDGGWDDKGALAGMDLGGLDSRNDLAGLDLGLGLADTLESRSDVLDEVKQALDAEDAGSAPDAPKRTMLGMAFDPAKIKEAVEAGKAASTATPSEPEASPHHHGTPPAMPAAMPAASMSDELPRFEGPPPIAPRDLRETEPVGHPQPDASLLGGHVPAPLRGNEGASSYAKGKGELAGSVEEAHTRPAPPAPAPAPVGAAVRPPAGLGAPAPRPTPAPPRPSMDSGPPRKGPGRIILVIALVFVALLLAAVLAGVLYVVFSRGDAPPPTVGATVGASETEVTVQLPPGAGPATVTFGGQSHEVEAEGKTVFTVDNEGLKVGDNAYPLEVHYANGGTAMLDGSIELPAKVKHDLTAFDAGELRYSLVFTLPRDATLSVLGEPVDPDTFKAAKDGTVTVRVNVPLEEIARNVAEREEVEFRHRVFYTVTFPAAHGGQVAEGDYFVTLRFPRCVLAVNNPPPRWITAERVVQLSGWAEPGAEIRVEGTGHKTAVGDDGRFNLGIDVPVGETRFGLVATRQGKVPARAEVRVRRVEAATLRAEIKRDRAAVAAFVKTDAPRQAAELVGTKVPAGEAVRVEGRISGAAAADDSAILFVEVCPEPDTCVVALEARGWLTVQTGDRVSAGGRTLKPRAFRVPGQQDAHELLTVKALALALP